MKQWCLAILKWSDKWRDPSTNKPGCAYYSTNGVDNDEHVIKDADGNEFKMYRVYFNNEDRENVPCLQVPGGKAVLQVFPKRAYMNINKSYKGLPFMSEEDYDAEVQAGNMVNATVVPITKQPAQLD